MKNIILIISSLVITFIGCQNETNSTFEKNDSIVEIYSILKVIAVKDNILEIDGKRDSLANLKFVAKQFIMEKSIKSEEEFPLIGKQLISDGIIEIGYFDNNSFDLYLSVQDTLVSTFNEIRNVYSLRFFQESFDKLDKDESEIILSLVPLSITEELHIKNNAQHKNKPH